MKMMWKIMPVPVAAAALTIAGVLSAQTLGTITGEVRDPSGATVPNAAITATNIATNAVRNTVSTDQGLYSFPGLVPGDYEVKVEVPGFRTAIRRLRLEVQQTARVDFKLEVGAVTSTVEVSALAALLTTENATVGTVIENRRIVDLPLNGRNFLQLVSLSPNVSYGVGTSGTSGRVGGARTTQNMAVAGMRTVWNNYTLDGMPDNDPNINSYILLPSVDFLQEFKVQTGIYPAEFGRAATQINVSTKGGTNQFHGSLYEFVRNDKFDAKSYAFTVAQATQPKNPFQWNQYGFTFGGPVWIPKIYKGTDKLFFSSNFEQFRQVTRANAYYSTPSKAMRQGNFSELLPSNQLWDPEGRSRGAGGTIIATPFPGNIIPASREAYQAKVMWEFWPEPNRPSESPTQLLRNYYTVNRGRINRDQFHLRIDFIESSSSNWFGRFGWSDEVELTSGIYKNGNKVITQPKQYMISNTRTLSPTLVNEFRFGITDHFNSTGRELAGIRNVVDELKIPGLSTPNPLTWGTPRMTNIGNGLSGFGDPSDGPFAMNTATFYASDGFSVIRGRHSFKFGGEARRDRFNNLGNEFGRGSFEFPGSMTQDPNKKTGGYSAADFYLGYPTRAEAALTNAFHQFRATSLAFYADDTWRISSALTINAGLRYEFTQPWKDRAEKYVNIYFPAGYFLGIKNVADISKHPVMVRQGKGDFYEGIPFRYVNVQVARDGRLGDRLAWTDKNDFAPRLGIAWSPTSKWSIRAGAGIFYSQEIGNPRFDMTRTLAGRVDRRNDTSIPIFKWENFLGTGGDVINISTPYTWGAQYRLPTTFALNYIFNIQRQLSETTMLEVGYVGSATRRLQSLFDANAPMPSNDGSPPNTRAPFPEFGVIQMLDGNGRGIYHGGSIKLTRRMAAGLTVLSSYTWSKSIDTASGIRGQGDAQSPNDSRCLRCERGVSGFNKPHRSVTSLVYELPFGRGRQFGGNWNSILDYIAGGWQISAILTFESGNPATPYSPQGRNSMAYVLGDRLNCTGIDWRLPADQRTTNRWFNIAAFALPAQGEIGNCGRNVLIGPGRQMLDGSLQKSFRVMEGHSLQFRMEGFNAWNHRVLGTPGTSWGSTNPAAPSATFGQITSTAVSMRQLQFGLKYVF